MQKKKLALIVIIVFIPILIIILKSLNLYKKDSSINKINKDYYAAQSNSRKKNSTSIPVLMYHSIREDKTNPYMVSPDKFKEDMLYLKENNFNTLTTDEFYFFIVNDIELPKKSLLITFDDGYKDNYTNAFPILKEYNLKATFFVVANYIEKESQYLTWDQLKEMQASGMDIQSHTLNHDKLGSLTYEQQLNSLKLSKEILEKNLNKKIDYFTYPFGNYNIDTLNVLKTCGYKMAFTTDGRWAHNSNGILTLNRVFISGFHSQYAFKLRVNSNFYLFKYLYY